MAERQPAQRRAGVLDNVEDWMAQRNADAYRLKRDAEAAGREAWERATRSGENIAAMRPSDVLALGANLLRHGRSPPTQQGRAVPIPTKRSAPTSTPTKDSGVLDYAGKTAVRMVAQPAGQVAGVFRGARNTVRDLGESAAFGARLLNPADSFTSPPGEAAWNHVLDAGGRAVDYVRTGISNPRSVAGDAAAAYRQARINLDPSATPKADTIGGEWKRGYEIGKNQGELAFDVGSTLYGGAVLKELAGLGYMSKEAQIAKRLKQGFDPIQAEYLAEPYEGMGHHNVARAYKFPEKIGPLPRPKTIVGQEPPEWFIESPFNVLEPRSISRGDFYELHYKVDPRFYGARMPKFERTGGWRGSKLGLEEYDGLERAWYGAPAPLKAAVGSAGIGAGAVTYDGFDAENRR
ncbi:hypothetical protein [Phenylobacterium sp.]|uniref:hypothetical protein n=1 Tax=Phenylobacterium sp. TaxID=1871053 RepID=UPI003BAC65E0